MVATLRATTPHWAACLSIVDDDPVQVQPGAIGESILGHGGVDRLQVGGA